MIALTVMGLTIEAIPGESAFEGACGSARECPYSTDVDGDGDVDVCDLLLALESAWTHPQFFSRSARCRQTAGLQLWIHAGLAAFRKSGMGPGGVGWWAASASAPTTGDLPVQLCRLTC
jgi:hypothetical protein